MYSTNDKPKDVKSACCPTPPLGFLKTQASARNSRGCLEDILQCVCLFQAITETVDVAIDVTGQTEEDNTGQANQQGQTCSTIAAESGNGRIALLDIHCLHDKQIILERNHRIHQGDEHQQMMSGVESGLEDEELREEACKGRYTCQ